MAKKSSTTDYRTVLSEIKKKEFSPVYLLMGEEDYFINIIVDLLEHSVVEEDEKDFNLTTFYGADTDIRQVISRSQQFPVMAERQLVMLKEAQAMLNAKKELEKLTSYIDKPNKSTILVISFKGDSLGASSTLVKEIQKNGGVVLKSDRPKDFQVPGYVADYCRDRGIGIDDKAISLLCEYIGVPLSKLFGEIDKLIVASGSEKKITPSLIESIIGISKEYNTFELIKSISVRDYATSMKIVSYFSKNPKLNPCIMVQATIFNYFSKLFIASISKDKSDSSLIEQLDLKSSYALTDYKAGLRNYNAGIIDSIIHAIREMDAKSKGIESTQNEFDLLKELIFKIFTLR